MEQQALLEKHLENFETKLEELVLIRHLLECTRSQPHSGLIYFPEDDLELEKDTRDARAVQNERQNKLREHIWKVMNNFRGIPRTYLDMYRNCHTASEERRAILTNTENFLRRFFTAFNHAVSEKNQLEAVLFRQKTSQLSLLVDLVGHLQQWQDNPEKEGATLSVSEFLDKSIAKLIGDIQQDEDQQIALDKDLLFYTDPTPFSLIKEGCLSDCSYYIWGYDSWSIVRREDAILSYKPEPEDVLSVKYCKYRYGEEMPDMPEYKPFANRILAVLEEKRQVDPWDGNMTELLDKGNQWEVIITATRPRRAFSQYKAVYSHFNMLKQRVKNDLDILRHETIDNPDIAMLQAELQALEIYLSEAGFFEKSIMTHCYRHCNSSRGDRVFMYGWLGGYALIHGVLVAMTVTLAVAAPQFVPMMGIIFFPHIIEMKGPSSSRIIYGPYLLPYVNQATILQYNYMPKGSEWEEKWSKNKGLTLIGRGRGKKELLGIEIFVSRASLSIMQQLEERARRKQQSLEKQRQVSEEYLKILKQCADFLKTGNYNGVRDILSSTSEKKRKWMEEIIPGSQKRFEAACDNIRGQEERGLLLLSLLYYLNTSKEFEQLQMLSAQCHQSVLQVNPRAEAFIPRLIEFLNRSADESLKGETAALNAMRSPTKLEKAMYRFGLWKPPADHLPQAPASAAPAAVFPSLVSS